jgi:2-keto-4-pentenoate hydratase/2-oxohepta-3-ene-1,7-dioic acid hydratase in catechol pathway
MTFSVAQLVSRISLDMTLMPGDVILCGTSVGVGSMKPGSLVEVEIDGIGRLANRNG